MIHPAPENSGIISELNDSGITLTDVHAHCQEDIFRNILPVLTESISECSVSSVINNATGADWDNVVRLEEEYGIFRTALAVHPWYIGPGWEDRISRLYEYVSGYRVCAVGECGLDSNYRNTPIELQQRVFEEQLVMAKEISLPVITHISKSFNELYLSLKRTRCTDLPVIIHGFHGSPEIVSRFEKANVFYSFNAAIGSETGKIKKSRRIIMLGTVIEKKRLLLESDSPFTGLYKKGESGNNPCSLISTLSIIASMTGRTVIEIAKTSSATARKLFP